LSSSPQKIEAFASDPELDVLIIGQHLGLGELAKHASIVFFQRSLRYPSQSATLEKSAAPRCGSKAYLDVSRNGDHHLPHDRFHILAHVVRQRWGKSSELPCDNVVPHHECALEKRVHPRGEVGLPFLHGFGQSALSTMK
jgi:hypothetical protein